MTNIVAASFPQDRSLVETLFTEYQKSLGIMLDFQSFDKELALLPDKYSPPKGNIVIAWESNQPAGCVAWYELEKTICEVKRLYVRPAFRGRNIGKQLLDYAIDAARVSGYEKLRLDSLERLKGAAKLYEHYDFRRIAPYNENPHPDVYYLELNLQPIRRMTG